ncbi:MAG: hypothetical protein WBG50_17635, partial [Desulfomonilaceae bacterium]
KEKILYKQRFHLKHLTLILTPMGLRPVPPVKAGSATRCIIPYAGIRDHSSSARRISVPFIFLSIRRGGVPRPVGPLL